jgi:hypothetical protein
VLGPEAEARPVAVGGIQHQQVLDAVNARQDRADGPGQLGVGDQDLVAGVVDDVGELVAAEADVQGVVGGPHQGGREVRLQVAVVVPAEGGHPVAGADPELAKPAGQAGHPLGPLAVGRPPHPAGCPRDQRFVREQGPGPLVDGLDGERVVHHQADLLTGG